MSRHFVKRQATPPEGDQERRFQKSATKIVHLKKTVNKVENNNEMKTNKY